MRQDDEIAAAMGRALEMHREGRIGEAEVIYRGVLGERPGCAEAIHLLGLVAHTRGEHRAAAELIARAVELEPGAVHYRVNLSEALRLSGMGEEAVAAGREATRRAPGMPEAHNNLGNALRQLGRWDEAVESYRRAVELRGDAKALTNLGSALRISGKLGDAELMLRRALEVNATSALARNELGAALRDLGRVEEGIEELRRAIALDPKMAAAHGHLGGALTLLGRDEEAAGEYEKAIAIDSGFVDAHFNLGVIRAGQKRWEEAIGHYDRAIALRANDAEARWNKGIALLTLGDFEKGWEGYEARWKVAGLARAHEVPLPGKAWEGEELKGKTILVYAEQGYGDLIQFVRYARLLRERGAKVVVGCPAALHGLLETMPEVERTVASAALASECELHCAVMSLPRLFGTRLETIPDGDKAYLFAKAARVEQWKGKLRPWGSAMKVGLAWAGRAEHPKDRERSMELGMLKPILEVGMGVAFFSLQKDRTAGDERVVDFTRELNDFGETAALIANLDLVISVDTAVAHLAGAMGKRVWVMLPWVADFRWLVDREDSPWYSTMKLFRQKRSGNWSEVIDRVAAELRREGGQQP